MNSIKINGQNVPLTQLKSWGDLEYLDEKKEVWEKPPPSGISKKLGEQLVRKVTLKVKLVNGKNVTLRDDEAEKAWAILKDSR